MAATDLSNYTALMFTAEGCSVEETADAYRRMGVRIIKRKSGYTNAVICHPTLKALSAKDKAKATVLTEQGLKLIQSSDLAEARGELIDLEAQNAIPNELHINIVTSRGEKFAVRLVFTMAHAIMCAN